jgi:hypothetical protein
MLFLTGEATEELVLHLPYLVFLLPMLVVVAAHRLLRRDLRQASVVRAAEAMVAPMRAAQEVMALPILEAAVVERKVCHILVVPAALE